MTDLDGPSVPSTTDPGRPPWEQGTDRPSTYEPFPAEAVEGSIGTRLEWVAEHHGDRVALRGPSGELTHRELWASVAGVATALVDRVDDADHGRTVAMLTDHDITQMQLLLGVVTAGQAALVLDPTAPSDLNRTLLVDADTALVVCDARHRDQAEDLAGPDRIVVDLDELDGPVGDLPVVPPDRTALLAYTSGTSGAPKAAVVPHRQLLHLVRGATDVLAISPDDTLPMLFPISLAVAAYPALLPILNGATLATFDVRGEGLADLPAWIADQGITVAYLAPTVLLFIEDAVGETTFPDLRLVVLGGERVEQGAIDLARSLFGDHVEVANGYGTTETGVLSFWFTDPAVAAEGAVPVGYPIDGMDLLIVGDDGEPLPAGEAGELAVRSRFVFAGYRGRPDLDELVLTADAATGVPVYRTGDLAHVDERGALHLAGRVDTQVKVRGRRVLLAEVEEAVLARGEVRDGAVVAGVDPAGHVTIVAHVVPAEGDDITVDGLRSTLSEALPVHMVPAVIEVHAELPQLPNGKLDRRALTERSTARPALSTEFVPPAEGLASDIALLWEELLGITPVGADDDFFDLGGNSLLGARMLVELENRLGHRVPMAALMDGATVSGLVAAVEAHARGDRPGSGLITLQEGDPDRPVLYLTHDLLGSMFRYRHLVEALGPDQPVKGFESPALTGEKFPFTRIETLALRYATELRRAQPHGPYHLCGYSFGGILAFEIARHLRRAGEEVPLLAVIDIGPGYRGIDYSRTQMPDGPWLDLPAPPEPDTSVLGRVAHAARLTARSPRQGARYAAFHSRFRPTLHGRRWKRSLGRNGVIPAEERVWYAYETHWGLVGPSWKGAPYDGPVTLFWSEETGATDGTMGWGPLVDDLMIERLWGGHEELLDPGHVEALAQSLSAASGLKRA